MDNGQLFRWWTVPTSQGNCQLFLVNCQLMFVGPGDQTGRPYIRRLMDSGTRRRAIVNCQLSIVN